MPATASLVALRKTVTTPLVAGIGGEQGGDGTAEPSTRSAGSVAAPTTSLTVPIGWCRTFRGLPCWASLTARGRAVPARWTPAGVVRLRATTLWIAHSDCAARGGRRAILSTTGPLLGGDDVIEGGDPDSEAGELVVGAASDELLVRATRSVAPWDVVEDVDGSGVHPGCDLGASEEVGVDQAARHRSGVVVADAFDSEPGVQLPQRSTESFGIPALMAGRAVKVDGRPRRAVGLRGNAADQQVRHVVVGKDTNDPRRVQRGPATRRSAACDTAGSSTRSHLGLELLDVGDHLRRRVQSRAIAKNRDVIRGWARTVAHVVNVDDRQLRDAYILHGASLRGPVGSPPATMPEQTRRTPVVPDAAIGILAVLGTHGRVLCTCLRQPAPHRGAADDTGDQLPERTPSRLIWRVATPL